MHTSSYTERIKIVHGHQEAKKQRGGDAGRPKPKQERPPSPVVFDRPTTPVTVDE